MDALPAPSDGVGHSYSAEELIAGKETALESSRWEAVRDHHPHRLSQLSRQLGQRAALAREHDARPRSVIQADRPVAAVSMSAGYSVGPGMSS
jgi:predicted ABC-type transport system involved in lysophospholipase L1 biosynthesis ATPase subunit